MLELAALYALGTLSAGETAVLRAHLETGCLTCQEAVDALEAVVGHLGYAAPPAHPPSAVRHRLLTRIQTEAATNQRAWTIVRHGVGGWEAVGVDGIWLKSLYRDPAVQRRTALVRMPANVGYPARRYADTEELYMLAGDLTIEAQVLRAGDFCAVLGGSHHGSVYSAEGCLFLLMASERDEAIADEEAGAPQSDLVCVRASEGSWVEGPTAGVAAKPLFSDPVRQTMTALVRMQAGARLPRHRHVTPEQFYMLEGDGHVAGQVLQPGDYYRIAADTVHDLTFTEGGCVFLLISSRIEILS
jgi:anti-sigma factor ChrR (cupin superfamily)